MGTGDSMQTLKKVFSTIDDDQFAVNFERELKPTSCCDMRAHVSLPLPDVSKVPAPYRAESTMTAHTSAHTSAEESLAAREALAQAASHDTDPAIFSALEEVLDQANGESYSTEAEPPMPAATGSAPQIGEADRVEAEQADAAGSSPDHKKPAKRQMQLQFSSQQPKPKKGAKHK